MTKAGIFADEEEIQQTLENIKSGNYKPETDVEEDTQDFEDNEATPAGVFRDVPDEEWGRGDQVAESEEEQEEAVDTSQEKTAQKTTVEQKTPEDLEAIAKLIDTGEETVGKVKGQDVDFSNFSPQERLALQQKGLRFYQAMEEIAQQQDQLKQAEAQLIQNARMLVQAQKTGQLPGGPSNEATIPRELQDKLQENEYDDENTKSLKAITRDLLGKFSVLEQSAQQQQLVQGEQELMNSITELQKEDYPLASTEEIIAVKAMYNDIPIERIAMKSHQKYSSKEHVKKVFDSCPDVRQHFYEDAVNTYLAKQKNRKTVPSKPLGSSKRIMSEGGPKPKGRDYDWDDAQADINNYLRDIRRAEREES